MTINNHKQYFDKWTLTVNILPRCSPFEWRFLYYGDKYIVHYLEML